MKDAAPVVIITGNDHFRRRRFLSWFIQEMEGSGRVVHRVEGDNRGAIIGAMSEAEFAEQPTVIVVDKASKVDLELVESHHKGKDNTVVLALHYEGTPKGNTKFGKLVKKLRKVHKEFKAPKDWDADEDAVGFCLEEAQRLGKTLPQQLAKALVALSGSDLGLLSFELLKLSTLADARGTTEITAEFIKAIKADIAEAQVFPVVRALEGRDVKRLLRSLAQVRKLSKDDPTMWVCRIVGSSAMRWLAVACLDAQGVQPEAAARQLDMNKWYYRNKVLPPARRWGKADVVRLVRALAESERAVLDGHVDPWVGLVSRLVQVC